MSRSPPRRRVLLVEDNPGNRYLAEFLLSHGGFEVITAANGRDGVALALAERPDLIVMDLQMPEMDGYEAAAAILCDARTRDIPIVATTAFAHSQDRDKAKAIGFSDYLEKPFDADTLVARVRANLRRG